jgi:hypothetical protein
MGMFDSFFVDVDGHPVELQSKRFACGLGHYHRGDFVDGALPGVRVFFDELMLDENSTPVYGDKSAEAIQKTAFIVLVEGIFVDDQVHDGALDSTAILAIVQQLKERWSDSARALAFMSEALRQRQYHLRSLRGTLINVSLIIATARRLRAGETLDERFELIWEENKKLAAGEDPLEVIAWALDQQRTRGFSISEGSQTDPLAEFRL